MNEVRVLHVPQRFDFSQHKTFTEQYNEMLEAKLCNKIIMDFSRTEYLDSSALGMMVLLNKKAKLKNINVSIQGAKDNAKDILLIANFEKLFNFEQ
ncbi:MAG: STAS domain-containing protein [Paraglaciecola polaris]|uniref:STAS domain-containing protein n=1 Tax=Paraglaciecola polaris TaxID=222814 RepID=UPI0030018783|tara:strand:+ start:1397 stop:1684 length:288 start_codon:yes stop_codon:yes gene_type:complete